MGSGLNSPPALGRRDRKTLATRRALLDTAREVFVEVGYEGAHKDEILRRAGVSNGSLYHHFGGKAELFLALFDTLTRQREDRADRAVQEKREAGVDDPMAHYLASCRAYMNACWDDRDVTILFASGEGPPGFAAARERLLQRWIERNARLLGRTPDDPLTHAITAVMSEAGRLIARSADQVAADVVREDFLGIISRMSAGVLAPAAAEI
ncbi:hypothetical protein AXA44_21995 [Rhodococcus sp. SC4]|nr:hypothetical protein AXA44_21995 [Rhodococcus sp. SC4]